jgi:hypothetical protein
MLQSLEISLNIHSKSLFKSLKINNIFQRKSVIAMNTLSAVIYPVL